MQKSFAKIRCLSRIENKIDFILILIPIGTVKNILTISMEMRESEYNLNPIFLGWATCRGFE